MEDKAQCKVPIKLFGSGDKILFNRLSLPEAGQWLCVLGLVYLDFNFFPFPGPVIFLLAIFILTGGWYFIHTPFEGGESGLTWVSNSFKFWLRRKRKRNHTIGTIELNELKRREAMSSATHPVRAGSQPLLPTGTEEPLPTLATIATNNLAARPKFKVSGGVSGNNNSKANQNTAAISVVAEGGNDGKF